MTADGGRLGPVRSVVPIPEHDPLSMLLVSRAAPVPLDGLTLDSAALDALRAAGVALVVPLVVEGRLLGTINLGRRRSDQEYGAEDRNLLAILSSQLAPAVQLASLVRRQEEQAAERERIDQELKVARVIQQTLLPRDLPDLRCWKVNAFYRPAREVGGDFYDIIPLSDDRMVLVEGDVTDKGVPAALVMATCRAALRAAAASCSDPGEILGRTNAVLVEDIPANMFVTCFCAVFERGGDRLRFANAGHPLPILVTESTSEVVRATGMPLGMLPGSSYEVVEVVVPVGGRLVVASDGVAEAHAMDGTMFGFERLRKVVDGADDPASAIVADVGSFSQGPQEDDITIVVLERKTPRADARPRAGAAAVVAAAAGPAEESGVPAGRAVDARPDEGPASSRPLLAFRVPSQEGVEREAMERVVEAARAAGIGSAKLRKLATVVAEAVMNAAEHGNHFDPERSVEVRLHDRGEALAVEVFDESPWKHGDLVAPDIEAKMAGSQSPRGWGRFLITKLADGVEDDVVEGRHVLRLRLAKEES